MTTQKVKELLHLYQILVHEEFRLRQFPEMNELGAELQKLLKQIALLIKAEGEKEAQEKRAKRIGTFSASSQYEERG